MIDHISLRVQDFERALGFYRAALAPIGYEVLMAFPGAAGLGKAGKPDFWIMQSEPPFNATHVAFASERELVDAFHSAAIAAGGSDNGPPGLRPHYHPHYYGAFVFDPEGNNVEVVCHADPAAAKAAPASRKPAARKAAPKKVKAKARAKPKAKPVVKPKAKPAKASSKRGAKKRR